MGENARFTKFTKAEYDELYQKLVDKEFSIPYDLELANKEDEIVVARVTVTVVGN